MTPYTYLIGWSNLNKFYYGAQWNKKSNPNDLMTKYFTSSKIVKHYIQTYGLPRTTLSVEICSCISPFIGVIGRRLPGCESAILLARTAVGDKGDELGDHDTICQSSASTSVWLASQGTKHSSAVFMPIHGSGLRASC